MLPYNKLSKERFENYLEYSKMRMENMIDFVREKTNMNPDSMRVVDLGCGEGYESMILGRYFGKVYGVDKNDDMLDYARGNKRRYDLKLKNVRFYWGLNDNFPIEKVSLLFLNNSLIFLDKGKDVIEGLFNKLANGGLMWIKNGKNFHALTLNPKSANFNEVAYNRQIKIITDCEDIFIKYAEDNGMEILRRISNDKMNEIIIKKN